MFCVRVCCFSGSYLIQSKGKLFNQELYFPNGSDQNSTLKSEPFKKSIVNMFLQRSFIKIRCYNHIATLKICFTIVQPYIQQKKPEV